MKNTIVLLSLFFLAGCAVSESRVNKALGGISTETNKYISEHERAPKNKDELRAYAKAHSKHLDFSPFQKISFSADTSYFPSFTYEVSYQVRGTSEEHGMMGSTIACIFK